MKARDLKRKLRKNKIINWVFEELYIIKVWKRNRSYVKESSEFVKKTMHELKNSVRHRNVYFLCIPDHSNLGDQAQRWCIENWIKSNYPNYNLMKIFSRVFYDRHFKKQFPKYVKSNDIFIIQSGYCTTSWHPDHPVHRFIVKNFKNNKILIMPQTVRYIYRRDQYITSRIYNQNKNLLFLVRDSVSYDFAKKVFNTTKIKLYPDIVTTLIGSYDLKKSNSREGILFCIRNDAEKLYSDGAINIMVKNFENNGIFCDMTDTSSPNSFLELQDSFEYEFSKMLSFFAKHKLIITDRYHGTIFSLISNTPVIVIKSNDHKVVTGVDWFNGVYDETVFLAEDLEQAYCFALRILSENKIVENKAYFQEHYYDKLKRVFENNTSVESGGIK